MAAIDSVKKRSGKWGAITAAALALPGVMSAQAEEPPEKGVIALKYLHYRDSQTNHTIYPGYDGSEGSSLNRIRVNSPSVYLLVPTSHWSLEVSGVVDQVSGATPRYYSDVSGATKSPGGMKDERKAGDVKVTRYMDRGSVGVGLAYSTEHDYRSTAVSLEGRYASLDKNTTWNIGLAGTSDTINPVNQIVVGERKRTVELTAGVTQALSTNDLAQLSLTYSGGRGYYDDPYKLFDHRPRTRNEAIGMLRWNHHFDAPDATLRSSYRFYNDSFGIHAHTVEAAWVQPVTSFLTITPSVRYYSQNSASFYYDPVTDASVYPGPLGTPAYSSTDQRLSAFGAASVGLKGEIQFGRWSTDLKVEQYVQRSEWRLGGKGTPGIDPFSATTVQLGLSAKF